MRAFLDKDPAAVASMFDAVAARYDLMNDVASLGFLRYWRRAATATVVTRPGLRVLDVAAGTGMSSATYQRAGAQVVAADFSRGMLAEGRRRRPQLDFTYADAMNLPFADASFDCVTISYGLRNVQDPARALREFWRVTKPGGHLVVCEFSHPTWGPFAALYRFFLGTVLPALARLFSSDAESYTYLAESILAWPTQRELGKTIAGAGWSRVQFRNLTGGIVALHRAQKPVQKIDTHQ